MSWDDRIRSLAQKHGFEPQATEFMARTIERAEGTLAEWDHPGLGGLGEWIPGTTILHPRNPPTEKRLDNLCLDLLAALKETGHATQPGAGADIWWPKTLGLSPDSTGSQNQVRYAYFADIQRLAVDRGDGQGVTVYDTGDHEIKGVSQPQSSPVPGDLVFQSQLGPVELHRLKVVQPPSV